MNADEKHLIADVFTRLRTAQGSKDQDADALIRDYVRQFPDAPYYLTQSVIVQQQALEQADSRIRELEATVRNMQGLSRSLGGSFLGDRPDPSAPARPGPWGSEPNPPPPQQQSGGFLSSVLSTATGVAGGMFLAESIRSLFGSVGGRSYLGGESYDQAALDRAQDEAQDARDDADQARRDLAADDAALDDMQDAQDDGSWADDDGVDA